MLFNYDRASELMGRSSIDALVVALPKNVAYAAGYRSEKIIRELYDAPAVCIVPRDQDLEATLIAGITDLGYLVDSPSWVDNVRIYNLLGYSKVADMMDGSPAATDDRLNPAQLAVKRLRQRLRPTLTDGIAPGVVAAIREMDLESATLACDDAALSRILAESMPAAHLVPDGLAMMRKIRVVKTGEEIEILRQGARVNERAVRKAIATTHPGTVWQDVIDVYKLQLAREGAVWAGETGLMFGAGLRSSGVYEDTTYTVADGDLVVFDAQGYYKGYAFDIGRTGTVGPPSDPQRKHYNAVHDGLLAAESIARAGVMTAELEGAVLGAMTKHDIDLPELTLVRVHSLGHDVAEVPYSMYQRSLQSFALEINMVVNIDVFHYALGEGGYHLERTIRITDAEPEHLYELPIDLIELA